MSGGRLVAAIDRLDVANYVDALFLVFIILIFIRVLLSWIPRMPYNRWLAATVDFVHQVTDPYLNVFRRFLPPLGEGDGDRHQPDPGDHRAVHRSRADRRPDRGLRPAVSGRSEMLARALLVCGAVVALDQVCKAIVIANVERGSAVELLPFLEIANTRNSGVAFGLAGGVSPALIGAALVLLMGLLAYLGSRSRSGWALWLPAGLLIGGALGNLADRVREGAVIDYVDLPVWATFNLADVAIVVGVVLLVLAPERRPE